MPIDGIAGFVLQGLILASIVGGVRLLWNIEAQLHELSARITKIESDLKAHEDLDTERFRRSQEDRSEIGKQIESLRAYRRR